MIYGSYITIIIICFSRLLSLIVIDKMTNNNLTFKITNKQKKIGQNLSFFIKTYGCPSNERDTENIKGILIALNFKEASDQNLADLIILNTCAIRQNVENKVLNTLYLLNNNKKLKKIKYFGICGCMAHEENVINEIKQKVKNIDFVFGTQNIYELPQILEKVILDKKTIVEKAKDNKKICEKIPEYRTNKHKALINIMYGCNHFCTYCIVPFVRGRIKSRSKENILKEVRNLIKNGCKEITLLGQNVNSYGFDFKKNYSFHNLLEDIAKTGIKRLRFLASNPWNFNKKIVDVIAKYPNIIKNIHIAIQSGDDEILKRMNRGTNLEKYSELCQYIREKIIDVSITTDFIVGFPNETNKQFKNTIKLYKKIKFDHSFVAIFSPRPGTKAAKMVDQIRIKTKEKRFNRLNKYIRKFGKINNKKYVGRIMEVMVDGQSKIKNNMITGRTINWKIVNFKGNLKEGEFCKVKIIKATPFSLIGEISNVK